MQPAEKSSFSTLIGPVIALVVVVVLDQATKIWALAALEPLQPKEVLGRFFMFTLVFNKGGALGTNFGSVMYYLIAAILILIFVLYYLVVNRHLARISYPLALIAGGAIGNIIDRVRFGQVVDFIDVDFFTINIWGYHLDRWWTFNIADSAISCSIVFLIITLFLHRHHRAAELPKVSEESPDDPHTESV